MVESGGFGMVGLVKRLVKRWIGSDGGNGGKLTNSCFIIQHSTYVKL